MNNQEKSQTPKQMIQKARAELQMYFGQRSDIDISPGLSGEGSRELKSESMNKLLARSKIGGDVILGAQDIMRSVSLRLELTQREREDYFARLREPLAMAILDMLEKGNQ